MKLDNFLLIVLVSDFEDTSAVVLVLDVVHRFKNEVGEPYRLVLGDREVHIVTDKKPELVQEFGFTLFSREWRRIFPVADSISAALLLDGFKRFFPETLISVNFRKLLDAVCNNHSVVDTGEQRSQVRD